MIFSKILRLLLLVFILWFIGFACFLKQINLTEPAINEKADAIIVLTGAKGRIDAGIDLLSHKYAKHLFISGVGQNAMLSDLSKYLSSFTTKQVALLESSITLGHFASSTEENALETSEWLRKNHYKRIILVTSDYHMPRSLYLFKHLIVDIEIIPYPIKTQTNINLTFLEYNKYLLSFLKVIQ